jgi:hypothetical protein
MENGAQRLKVKGEREKRIKGERAGPRGQKTEDGGQRTEDGGQRTDDRGQVSDDVHLGGQAFLIVVIAPGGFRMRGFFGTDFTDYAVGLWGSDFAYCERKINGVHSSIGQAGYVNLSPFYAAKRSNSRSTPLLTASSAVFRSFWLMLSERYSSPQFSQICAGTFLKTSVECSLSRTTVICPSLVCPFLQMAHFMA